MLNTMVTMWQASGLSAKIGYCMNGFRIMASEREAKSFRPILIIMATLQLMALAAPISAAKTVLIFWLTGIAPAFEIINTSIENTIDRISMDRHELSRNAKDLAAAASMWIQVCTIVFALLLMCTT